MKNLKKLKRENLKLIQGGAVCYENCPPVPYSPGHPKSCNVYNSLPECCKMKVLVEMECTESQY